MIKQINIVFDVTNFVTFSAEKNWVFLPVTVSTINYNLTSENQFHEMFQIHNNKKPFLFKMGLSWSYFKNTLNKIHFVSNSLKKHITN